jgi:hypothetical protein
LKSSGTGATIAFMVSLARGLIFAIDAEGDVVRCTLTNRADITPAQGADCAREIAKVLVETVLAPHSRYRGVIFDVSSGPTVFGPTTRVLLARIFRAAEAAKKRLAVRAGPTATQQLQFTNLCREHAPTFSRVFTNDSGAAWVTA